MRLLPWGQNPDPILGASKSPAGTKPPLAAASTDAASPQPGSTAPFAWLRYSATAMRECSFARWGALSGHWPGCAKGRGDCGSRFRRARNPTDLAVTGAGGKRHAAAGHAVSAAGGDAGIGGAGYRIG